MYISISFHIFDIDYPTVQCTALSINYSNSLGLLFMIRPVDYRSTHEARESMDIIATRGLLNITFLRSRDLSVMVEFSVSESYLSERGRFRD